MARMDSENENKNTEIEDVNSTSVENDDKKKHLCYICNKQFKFDCDLQRHKIIHTGEKPFSCDLCGKSFSRSGYRSVHMKKCKDNSAIPETEKSKTHCCGVCQKQFPVQSRLEEHMRTHTGERPFVCDICNKAFSRQPNLQAHMRTHTGTRPYSCPVCNKTFTHSSSVIFHMRTHTGERPYSCNICTKSFSQKSNLDSHMKTHTGEKQFVCEVCEKPFSRQNNLKVHMRIHTGEKPYSCVNCNRSFSDNSALAHHKKICRKGNLTDSSIVNNDVKEEVLDNYGEDEHHEDNTLQYAFSSEMIVKEDTTDTE